MLLPCRRNSNCDGLLVMEEESSVMELRIAVRMLQPGVEKHTMG